MSEGRGSEMLAMEIACGESRNLEFKRELTSDHKKYLKTVVAFSNGSGGRIIFGVADDRTVVGIPDDILFKTVDAITKSIIDSCDPPIAQDIYVQSIGDSSVIVLSIMPGISTPYYLKSEGREKGVYIRVNGVSVPADPSIIRSLELRGEGLSFDTLPRPATVADDASIGSLCSFLSRFSVEVTPVKLVNMGVLMEDAGGYMATNAFALLTSNPFLHARIQCARFSDSKGIVFADSRDLEGNIVDQAIGAVEFVMRNLAVSSKIESIIRDDRFEVPEEAIREAVVNAVVHRDYSLSGSSIFVRIFADRVEIESPGFPLAFDPDDPASGRSIIRNQAIASVFKAIGFIERYGTGITRMIDSCLKNRNRSPQFIEDGLSFKVVFSRVPLNDRESTEAVILDLLVKDPEITQDQIAVHCGVSIASVKRLMSDLVASGMVVREGSRKTGRWNVIRRDF